jgi:hypothetical protein
MKTIYIIEKENFFLFIDKILFFLSNLFIFSDK